MDWLAPTTGLIAAAVAIPTLVLLYFLKLRRREVPVSSTLLWKRAVQDLQVNAPFQRLRKNLLLLLQLIALAAILTALARPVLSLAAGPGKRYVILIDQSASMRATDVAPSRLAEAKRQAKRLVESLRTGGAWYLGGRNDQAMVMAFGPQARVLCNYTSDRAQLDAAIDSIEPTDGETLLAEAVTVARAFATPAGDEDKGRSAVAPATLELFSDGRIADLAGLSLAPGEANFHAIGRARENVAIVALRASRSFEEPDRLTVFADLANAGPDAAARDVQMSIDGNVRAVQRMTVPPAARARPGEPEQPGHVTVTFTLSHPGAGVLEVRLPAGDALPADDAAWAVLPPPRTLAVALVTRENPALAAALKACGTARFDVLKPEEFDRLQGPEGAADVPYDLVVLDRHAPAKLARTNYLVFGPPPAASGVRATGDLKNQWVVDWRSRHPALNFVNLENLFAVKAYRLDVPREAVVLAQFEDSPALVEVRRQGGLMILAGFDVLQTNWPFDAGFAMFCYNVAAYVGAETGQADAGGLKVGQPLTLASSPGVKEARVTLPDGAEARIASGASGVLRYARTQRAGVYRLAVEGGPERMFAVNLLDAAESDIGPATELVVTGQVVQAQKSEPASANEELWPLLVLAALAVVFVEWYVYNGRVRI